MRLTDADSIVKYIEELKTPDAPLIARIILDNIELFVKNAPTIDAIPVERVSEMIAEATMTAINTAIPVEQVARIISRITWQPPCAFVSDPWINEQNEHCREYCGTDSDNILCWENALKEGWFDCGSD